MCTQKPPHDYSEQLYNRYRDAFTKYIAEKVGWLVAAVSECQQSALANSGGGCSTGAANLEGP